MLTRMNVLVLSLACILTMGGCKQLLTDQGKRKSAVLQLAVSKQTEHVIVKPEKSTEVDDYAVSALTNFLFQKPVKQ